MAADTKEITHLSEGHHTLTDTHVIAEGNVHVEAGHGAAVDAWDESTVDAHPGSVTHVFSASVTVRVHGNAKVVDKTKGKATITTVEDLAS